VISSRNGITTPGIAVVEFEFASMEDEPLMFKIAGMTAFFSSF
jgi:hypothetical protein